MTVVAAGKLFLPHFFIAGRRFDRVDGEGIGERPAPFDLSAAMFAGGKNIGNDEIAFDRLPATFGAIAADNLADLPTGPSIIKACHSLPNLGSDNEMSTGSDRNK
jgi:hypothetical protein